MAPKKAEIESYIDQYNSIKEPDDDRRRETKRRIREQFELLANSARNLDPYYERRDEGSHLAFVSFLYAMPRMQEVGRLIDVCRQSKHRFVWVVAMDALERHLGRFDNKLKNIRSRLRRDLEALAEFKVAKDSQLLRDKISQVKRFLSEEPPPRVFLCHAKEDRRWIEEIHFDLIKMGIAPWYDEKELVIGDYWEAEILKAIANTDFFAVFLSKKSAKKRGFVQREIRTAIREYQKRPYRLPYFLPVRLEECEIPDFKLDEITSLRDLQWLDVFYMNPGAIQNLASGILTQWKRLSTQA